MQFIQQELLWQPPLAASDTQDHFLFFYAAQNSACRAFFEARFSFSPAFEGHI